MSKSSLKSLKIFVVAILVFCMGYSTVYSQSDAQITIDSVDDSDFPNMSVSVSVSDKQGYPVEGLLEEGFSITENALPLTSFEMDAVYQKDLKIVFVIDISESMGFGDAPTPMEATKQVIKDYLPQLGSDDEVAIISFAEDFTIEQDFTTNKQVLAEAIDKLEPAKVYSNFHQALNKSFEMLELEDGRRAVIAFTDSPDSGGGNIKIDRVIDNAVKNKIFVYPISWRFAAEEDLDLLAELTKGEAQFLGQPLPDLQEYEAGIGNVKEKIDILRAQYLLKYTSQIPNDDKEHTVTVKTEYLGSTYEASEVFIARTLGLVVDVLNLPEGTTVSEGFVVKVDAKSGAGVDKVLLYVDGSQAPHAVDDTADDTGTFELKLDVLPAGVRQFKVVAIDVNGLEVTNTVQVDYQIGTTIPWALIAGIAVGIAVLIPFIVRGRRKRPGKKGGRPGGAILRELEGMNPNREWPLVGDEIRLGRKRDENDIHLKGLGASRRHGMIQNRSGEFVLFVHNPDNPIFVNETPVTNQYVLRKGDILRAGETVLQFED